MALDDLISRLDRDGERRLEELRAKTETEVGALRAEAARASDQHREKELAKRRGALRAQQETSLAEARHRSRADRLRAQHALLEQIFARARASMPAFAASPAFAAVLPRHLQDALRYVEGLPIEVRCAPPFRAILEPLVLARGSATLVVNEGLAPGVVVSAADGSVFLDATLPALLVRLEPRLAVELLSSLGGQAP